MIDVKAFLECEKMDLSILGLAREVSSSVPIGGGSLEVGQGRFCGMPVVPVGANLMVPLRAVVIGEWTSPAAMIPRVVPGEYSPIVVVDPRINMHLG